MKEFVSEMENTESGLAQKFSNFLGEAIDRLKKLFQQIFSTLSRTKEAQSLRQLTDRMEAIQTQFDALLEGRTAESTSDQQKNTSDRGVMSAEREKNTFSQNFENGYKEGYYNIIVTQYDPDNFRKYLSDCEIVYDKKK